MGTGVGLATAFYRLWILHALEGAPQRSSAMLAALHASEGVLPLESGAFTKALQQLLDTGLVMPAEAGAVALTVMGRRERDAQRAMWQRLIAIVVRLLAGELPPPRPPTDGGVRVVPRAPSHAVDERDPVVLADVRDAARRAREGDGPFAVVLADVAVAHPIPHRATAMLQRALRETLGSARSTFGSGIPVHRYGTTGVCLVAPGERAGELAELLRARLLESLGAMCATVRSFDGARYAVRLGTARWSPAAATSGALLRMAEEALSAESAARAA